MSDEVEAAKQRVARRLQLRQEAAEEGRKLPWSYRQNLRQQFIRAEEEAAAIVKRSLYDALL